MRRRGGRGPARATGGDSHLQVARVVASLQAAAVDPELAARRRSAGGLVEGRERQAALGLRRNALRTAPALVERALGTEGRQDACVSPAVPRLRPCDEKRTCRYMGSATGAVAATRMPMARNMLYQK